MKILFLLIVSFNIFAHPFTPCDENIGMADIYPCMNIDLLQRVHIDHMGGGAGDTGSDIWGWTDPSNGREYAITAMSYATTFVDITDPTAPIYLGKLQTATVNSIWRDVKTYNNHAFIVSEASGHGMQIFDLTQLRDVTVATIPVEFTATANYTQFGNAHNIVINEETGFAYAVGTSTCNSGLHMVNIQNPTAPTNAGCFSNDGYTHDAQCVIYTGPDTEHNGKEICFNSNTDTITIVDVSTKNTPIQLSRTGYSNHGYTHQGWLTEDQRYYLMNDELDEQNNGHNTKTYIWDMLDIDAPLLIGFYNGPEASIDHNLYIKGNHAYLTNYTSGLSILDISDIGNGNLIEVANFDGYPPNDGATFKGAWSNYPYFPSGNVIMSDFDGGLFILGPKICPTLTSTQGLTTQASGDNSISLDWDLDLISNETYKVFRSEGGCAVDNFIEIADQLTTNSYIDSTVSGQVPVGYKIAKVGADGNCESERSMCVEVQTTGSCTIAPAFSGIESATSTQSTSCGINLQWDTASSYCGSNVSYDIYKSIDPAFVADNTNKIASNLSSITYQDIEVLDSQAYYYLVRATDSSNGNQETNNLKLSTTAVGIDGDGTWTNGAEVGDSGFGQTRHVGWEINNTRAHSGSRSYWSQNQSSICNDLTTETITLSNGQNSELSFWTAYDIESQFDGGVVEVTTDQNNWTQPALSPNYPGTFNTSSDACNYDSGTPSFTNTNLTWTQHTMDLSSFQGQAVNIRWNFSSDASVSNEGWYLDDFAITHTQIPSACTTITDILFKNDFE
jgi:choice-of-anchor B domain-containing protein